MTPDDRPSIATLHHSHPERSDTAILDAAPLLVEIAAAALVYRDSECDGQRCNHPAHVSPCAILKAHDALDAALAKVRP